jgi:hypothetical protein
MKNLGTQNSNYSKNYITVKVESTKSIDLNQKIDIQKKYNGY